MRTISSLLLAAAALLVAVPGLTRDAPLPELQNPFEVAITGRYLIFPVANDQAKRGRMTVIVGDELVHSLECDFPADEAGIDWWA
ncbi:MAG: hypothetical protein ACKOYJ_00415, partial [Planctomycetia bacterium]